MDERYLDLEWRPELERPVLVSAFTGWNDAAEAASMALSALGNAWGVRRFGRFDPEEFFDYQSTRPQVKLVDGVTRKIEWPENALYATAAEGVEALGGRGAVLLSGPEPNLRWRSFSEAVVGLARELGALLADVPHSRPVPVAANAQDASLVENLGLSASRYEGPTGITGVLHTLCSEAGLPAVSLWASMPHYLPAVPSAPGALALVQSLAGLLGTEVETGDLEQGAERYREQVSAAVARDPDLSSYVKMLEERYDASQEEGGGQIRHLPSGDELARELEDFLRRQRGEDEQ
jgi:hypothetical protein